MSTNINIRVDEELKKALQGYAKLENKTVSEIVLEAIKEKLENEYGTIVGSVCMDQMMVLCENPHEVDTPVEIYGEHINVKDRAKELDTISYELLTGLSDRLRRIYIQDNEIVNSIDPRF